MVDLHGVILFIILLQNKREQPMTEHPGRLIE